MKKIISLSLIIMLFVSCQDEIKTHNPGLQAYRDDFLFRGVGISATKDANGRISITALSQDEELTLDIASSNPGTYNLGTTNQNNKATYVSTFQDNELVYDTSIFEGPVSRMASTMTAAGSGYDSDCILVDGEYVCNSSHFTEGGSGAGLKVSVVTNAAGAITSVKSVASPGNNYLPGDLITIVGGNGIAKCKVLNVEGSNGEIVIESITNNRISGTFKFNAHKTNSNPTGNDLLNFQYGAFYNIPISGLP